MFKLIKMYISINRKEELRQSKDGKERGLPVNRESLSLERTINLKITIALRTADETFEFRIISQIRN